MIVDNAQSSSIPSVGAVVVVTGPPGAGKTTLSRLVTDRLPFSVHLHGDDFWRFINQGNIALYLPEARTQNRLVTGILARAAFGYAAGGYVVLCDGISGPWFLDIFRVRGANENIPLHYLVLRPEEPMCLYRASVRKSDSTCISTGPIRSLHHQFSGIGELESHVLDTTNMSIGATVETVLVDIISGKYILNGMRQGS
jgi:energy-coupling factor transporter ATP-binding protein EcfA2